MFTSSIGERSPRVVLIQILLNRAGAAPALVVDGRFGPKTRDAIVAFQRKTMGLQPSGRMDAATWQRLPRGGNMNVVDVVDVGDAYIGGMAVKAFTEAGGNPIELGLMCNGVGQMITSASSQTPGRTAALLRIMGHGNLGRWLTVSVGNVVHASPEEKKTLESEDYSYISVENFGKVAPVLAPLRSVFAPYGSAEHGGCSLGSRKGTQELLHKLADLWQVPVTVGVGTQSSFLKFDGATFTAFPNHGTLESWSRQFQIASY